MDINSPRYPCYQFSTRHRGTGDRFVLALDIGNSNTVAGVFAKSEEQSIPCHWRTVTLRNRTSDELGIFLLGVLNSAGIDPGRVEGFIYSSVVPSFNPIVERMAHDYFGSEPLRVRYDMGLPITISYPRPYEIGADRLVNACAVNHIYSSDAIIVDLGTATTFCVLHGSEYRGGVIGPGLKLSMEALSRNTAQLPPIEFSRPVGVIGDSTVSALQSGFFHGWVGLIKEIIENIRREEPRRDYRVIATGGLSTLIHEEIQGLFDEVDVHLTLKGLEVIYRQRNRA